jgi:hypothetical protein
MILNNQAAWGIIIGLAFMLVGGLMLWAYDSRRERRIGVVLINTGPEMEATQRFHARLAHWFFFYGIVIFAGGLLTVLLSWVVLR